MTIELVATRITITVWPSKKSPGRFDDYHGDRVLCRASLTPFCTAARALLAAGLAAPEYTLVMRHQSSGVDSWTARIEVATKLTVKESSGSPLFTRWTPMAENHDPGSPPMRETGAGLMVPGELFNIATEEIARGGHWRSSAGAVQSDTLATPQQGGLS